ncbi:MAG TPA: VOC family protein [Patescibacteria group bacterium]|nr:VOC family protein [Patescibacteria group bacterium]
MNIQTVTITVSDLKKSKEFYENLLGFTLGDYWAPTNWQSYKFNDQLFGIREKPGFKRAESFDITNFELDDVDSLWAKVKDKVKVVEKLAPTPWGSYRFVILDPDGYQLAFVAKQ